MNNREPVKPKLFDRNGKRLFVDMFIMVALIAAMNLVGRQIFTPEQWEHPARFWIVQGIGAVVYFKRRWDASRLKEEYERLDAEAHAEVSRRLKRAFGHLPPDTVVTEKMYQAALQGNIQVVELTPRPEDEDYSEYVYDPYEDHRKQR